jgi:hypothetical protein
MVSDLNQNICQWKHMGKSITDYIKTQADINDPQMGLKLSELSIDEITELGIYDSLSVGERKELLGKK